MTLQLERTEHHIRGDIRILVLGNSFIEQHLEHTDKVTEQLARLDADPLGVFPRVFVYRWKVLVNALFDRLQNHGQVRGPLVVRKLASPEDTEHHAHDSLPVARSLARMSASTAGKLASKDLQGIMLFRVTHEGQQHLIYHLEGCDIAVMTRSSQVRQLFQATPRTREVRVGIQGGPSLCVLAGGYYSNERRAMSRVDCKRIHRCLLLVCVGLRDREVVHPDPADVETIVGQHDTRVHDAQVLCVAGVRTGEARPLVAHEECTRCRSPHHLDRVKELKLSLVSCRLVGDQLPELKEVLQRHHAHGKTSTVHVRYTTLHDGHLLLRSESLQPFHAPVRAANGPNEHEADGHSDHEASHRNEQADLDPEL
mmetsp:Transcript_59862/g.159369  ORF Transcript_59862/g.159369 Transcript_59862/m.159369 type:complete len:368 (+) Transcript_59862:296-1399(+)